jgi:nitric oxide dioxygenase
VSKHVALQIQPEHCPIVGGCLLRAIREAPVPDGVGRPSLEQMRQWLPADGDFDAYFLGPNPFMAFIKRSLRELGVPEERNRYECFGPAEDLN